MEYIMNGQAFGDVAARLLDSNMDPLMLRPYKEGNRSYVTQNVRGADGRLVKNDDGEIQQQAVPLTSNNATLLKDEWIALDQTVIKAAQPRLRVVADMRGRQMTFNMPNGMAHSVLQSQAMSDFSPATITMDGLAQGTQDRPEFNLINQPLPLVIKDFSFSLRQIQMSRNGEMPLDMTAPELAGRRVAEAIEQMALGVAPTYYYGGGYVYGITNFPGRITTTLHDPTASSWTPRQTLTDVLAMKQLSIGQFHYGPWVLYVSSAWDPYMDDDFSTLKGDNTLRQRLGKIQGIDDIVTVDYLNGFDMVLVQMTTDVFREIIGMDLTTIQWETEGGMKLNFKVMAMMVPQPREDFNGNTGIVHGNVIGKSAKPTGAVYPSVVAY